jgi:FMN phosphatase YigB (HAD superfamily)
MDVAKPRIILWDVHEVLFTRNLLHWGYLLLQYPRKRELLCSLDWCVVHLIFLYILHVMHIRRTELSSQELIDYARRTHKRALLEITVRIGCDYVPIDGVVTIVRKLYEMGYTQHIASNLGSTVLATFRTIYPDIFSYFSEIQIAYYDHDRLIKKPDVQFFKTYCIRNVIDPHEVLFIDDKDYNIHAACSLGMRGIVFHNVVQLVKEFEKQGIDLQ